MVILEGWNNGIMCERLEKNEVLIAQFVPLRMIPAFHYYIISG